MTGNPTYGKDDKKVIKVHKKAYQEARDTAGCNGVVRNLILPDLLAFYKRTNHPRANAVEGDVGIVKELKEWTSNNWRKTATAKDSNDMKVNISVIVERMFRDRVDETLRDLLGVEELGQDPQREFQLWNRAIKMVRKSLSPEEMVSMNADKAQVAAAGNPPEKQRVTADRYGQSRIDADDKKRFMEMGMLSLSLVAWVDSNREFKVQAHNSMVFLKGSQKDTFVERNPNFMNEMLRKFLEYIFYLHDIACVAPNIGGATTAIGTGVEGVPTESPWQGAVGTDSRGYPRLPNAFPALTKDLVKLCREYMNAQYSIASGKPDSRMCVADVCEHPSSFIAGGCLPKDWDMTGSVQKNSTKKILCDPQNMDKGMLLDLLEHWRLREKAHGCAMALRFTHFMRGKERLPAVAPPAHPHTTMVSPRKKPTTSALDINALHPFQEPGDRLGPRYLTRDNTRDNTATHVHLGNSDTAIIPTNTNGQEPHLPGTINSPGASEMTTPRSTGNANNTLGNDERPARDTLGNTTITPPTNSDAGTTKQTTKNVTACQSETNIETALDNTTSAPDKTTSAPDNMTTAPVNTSMALDNTTIPTASNRASDPEKSIGKDNTQNASPGTHGNSGITTWGCKTRCAGDVEGSETMETGTGLFTNEFPMSGFKLIYKFPAKRRKRQAKSPPPNEWRSTRDRVDTSGPITREMGRARASLDAPGPVTCGQG
ncbi:hypothetical protein DXG01_003295 [Tephrocybe rancida]|nr:hypothetical protein DXG01_003295 [Tephrocybe rancida]